MSSQQNEPPKYVQVQSIASSSSKQQGANLVQQQQPNPSFQTSLPSNAIPVLQNAMSVQQQQQRIIQQAPVIYQYQQALRITQRFERDQRLLNQFPAKYVIFHSIFMLVIGILMIVSQVVLFLTNGFLNFVGSGIWAGFMVILAAIFSMIAGANRSYCMTVNSIVFHSMNLFFIMVTIVISGLGLRLSCYEYDFGPCNEELSGIFESVLLLIGILSFIMSLTYVIVIQCLVYARRNNSKTSANYQPQYVQQPQLFTGNEQTFFNPALEQQLNSQRV